MKTRTVKAEVVETLSTEWEPGCIRVPDFDKLERWRERADHFEDMQRRSMAYGFGGSGAADNFMRRLELREEREACYYDVYSEQTECEMRLKVRYAVKGKPYEREVTFTSNSGSVPEKLRLTCDRKNPENVLEVSADHSDDWFWFWVAMAAMTAISAVIVIPFIMLIEAFPLASAVALGAITLITHVAIWWKGRSEYRGAGGRRPRRKGEDL